MISISFDLPHERENHAFVELEKQDLIKMKAYQFLASLKTYRNTLDI